MTVAEKDRINELAQKWDNVRLELHAASRVYDCDPLERVRLIAQAAVLLDICSELRKICTDSEPTETEIQAALDAGKTAEQWLS